MMPSPLLVLWDIDLTLLWAGEAGRAIYSAAFARATGTELTAPLDAAGRLDPDIYRDALAAHGLAPAAHPFPAFAAVLEEEHERGAELLRAKGRVLAGAADALDALGDRGGVVQSVVTGNVEPVARRKLRAFGLDALLELDVGAYAGDAPTRAELVDVARRRASEKHGVSFHGGATVLIGDSAHDVAAALSSGGRIVAVATGRAGADDLREAGAPFVLDDLSDTAAVCAAVLDERAA